MVRPYQQSNQWAIETLALLAEPAVGSRLQARAWLRAFDYRPATLYVSTLKRLRARIGTAHIAFDDHPFDRRMAGRIETVTVRSVFTWLQRARLAEAPRVLRPRRQTCTFPTSPRRCPCLKARQIDLLQAPDTAVLVQIDAAAPDLAERPVVAIAQGKGVTRHWPDSARADVGLLERLDLAVRKPDPECCIGRVGFVDPAVAVGIEAGKVGEAVTGMRAGRS